jgi:hypothetical protein
MSNPALLLSAAFGVALSVHLTPAGPSVARQAALDSVVLERVPGFWQSRDAGHRIQIARTGQVSLRIGPASTEARVIRDTISPAAFDSIARRVAAIPLDSIPDVVMRDRSFCPMVATDHGTLIIHVFGARTKRIEYYLGCWLRPPDGASPPSVRMRPELWELRLLSDLIDELARTAELRGRPRSPLD